jgi:hypothetical protein
VEGILLVTEERRIFLDTLSVIGYKAAKKDGEFVVPGLLIPAG